MNIKFRKCTLTLGISAVVSLLLAGEALAGAGSSEILDVQLEGQPADQALIKLAKLSGVQIILPMDISEGKHFKPIDGQYTFSQALDLLLEGSGLTYEFSSDELVTIKSSETDSTATEDGVDDDVEEIIVTGSAIRNVQPTSQVKIYTAEDIARLGVGSTEDFIRKLPQNFSGLNTFSSTGWQNQRDNGGQQDAVGTTAADLGGLGNDATLILINGKRTAQSALFQGGVVNLANVPISAIEWVEIVLDGASARYGSDAVGGVINFITKKDYIGAETAVRYETGRNGSNTFRVNQLMGYNWGTGGVTGTFSYRERKPVDTAKLGITDYDHTDRGGSNWDQNFSLSGVGPLPSQYSLTGAVYEASTEEERCALFDVLLFPGACEAFGIDRFRPRKGDLLGYLPADNSGKNWTLADLSPANLAVGRYIPKDQGVFAETRSVSVSANQDITDNIHLYSELTYTNTESENRDTLGRFFPVLVPEENPFNNAGQDLFVEYSPGAETLSGNLPFSSTRNESSRIDFHIGVMAELPFKDWQVRFDLGYSREESESDGMGSADRAPHFADLTSLTDDYIARYNRYIELLNSTDPAVALNLFGNGSAQSPFIRDIYGNSFVNNPNSLTQSFEAQVDGSLFSLPGGEVRMALGMEYRKDERDYRNDILRKRTESFGGGFQFTEEPSRDNTAVYTELDFPLISEQNTLPGIQSLQLNVGFRWEEYGIDDTYAVSGIVNPGDIIPGPDGTPLPVGNYGNELNQLFDTLADWNDYLERYCSDVYSIDTSDPEP